MSGSQSPVPFSALFDNNNDANFESGSPGSKRCPSFKEFADKMKKLQQENFQLRLRIYLGEQKSGVKMSSSNIGTFFPPHQQGQFQQFIQSQQQLSNSNASAHSISANSETIKLQKEQLSMRVSELENKVHSYDILLKEKQKENTKLREKIEDCGAQIQHLETEVALAKIELQQHEMPSTLRVSVDEDEIERGARIAFGQYYDFNEIKADLESKLVTMDEKVKALDTASVEKQQRIDDLLTKEKQWQNKVEILKKENEQQKQVIGKDKEERELKIRNITKDNEDLRSQLKDFAKTFHGLGEKIVSLEKEKKALSTKTEEHKLEIVELRKKIVPPEVVLSFYKANSGNLSKRCMNTDDSALAALILDKKVLAERLQVSEAALTHLHQEHAKLVGELKILRNSHAREPLSDIPEKLVVEGGRLSESNSPDLGIDSGHDGAANSDDSNRNVFKEENRALRSANRELALKLRQTRQTLDMTLEKLHSTTKQKEQIEKTICRQLHKTHTILRNAKKNLEKSASAQCQENMVP